MRSYTFLAPSAAVSLHHTSIVRVSLKSQSICSLSTSCLIAWTCAISNSAISAAASGPARSMYVGICPYRSGRRWPPLRPVAPEQAPLASRIVIELMLGWLCSKCQAVLTPAYPAPMITTSLCVGRSSVDRWSCSLWGLFCQKQASGFRGKVDIACFYVPNHYGQLDNCRGLIYTYFGDDVV
jgi:hypothetical protein